VNRVLLVTQSARAIGEFRRPWVRAAYKRFVARHRRAVTRVCARLASEGEVTVLAARELIDRATLPPQTGVRYYDEDFYKLDAEKITDVTATLANGWWPSRGSVPELEHRGVWLPDVTAVARATVLRLEITELFGTVASVIREVKPTRVVVMSGASVAERLARAVADADGLATVTATKQFARARLYASLMR